MIEGAKATGNLSLLKDLSDLVSATATLANKAFGDAQKKVDQLNSELNSLIQGFGPGDEAKLQAAVAAFKERHKKDYAALESAGAALTNVLTVAGPLLETGKLDFGLATTLLVDFPDAAGARDPGRTRGARARRAGVRHAHRRADRFPGRQRRRLRS